MGEADDRLQAGKMVDEKYSLKAVVDRKCHPELPLLNHGPILAAGGPGVNFPLGVVASPFPSCSSHA